MKSQSKHLKDFIEKNAKKPIPAMPLECLEQKSLIFVIFS